MRFLSRDRFLRNNLIVFFGALVISGLSYLYYPVLARLLTFNDFGEAQTLVSILTQAGLIFGAINIVTVVLVSSDNEDKRNEQFLLELQKLSVYLVMAIGLIAIVASPLLQDFFNFQSVWPFLAMVLALIVNLPFIFWTSYLQGRQNFNGMNLLGILGAAGKLLFPTIFVLSGLGSFGAVFGLFIGQVVALVYISHKYKLPPLRSFFKTRLPDWKILQLELRYTVLVFIVTLMTALLYSGDILIVKHYASPELAGAYSGVASIARLVFFLTLPFATVLLPAIHSDWENRLATLKRSMTFVVALGGAACLVFWAFAKPIMGIMIGRRYENYAHLLPELSFAIFLISIANLLIYYLLAIRSLLSLLAAGAGVVLLIVLSVVDHSTLNVIVKNLLLSGILTLGILLITVSAWPRIRGFRILKSIKEME